MDPLQLAAAALCVLVGLSLGLLGGGGSVLMVPVLVYAARLPVNEAIATSLAVVGISSAFAVPKYFRQGFVNKRLVGLFVLPGVAASFLGARAARYFSSDLLLFLFGAVMMTIALILFKKSSGGVRSEGPVVCRPDFLLSVSVGAGIGFATGLLGVGGGFLIVPAIALLMKCSLHTAIGTSLTIIAVNSLAGFAGHLSGMDLNIPLSVLFLSATMGGAVLGARLSGRFSAALLQKGFAVFIFLAGLGMAAYHFPNPFAR